MNKKFCLCWKSRDFRS